MKNWFRQHRYSFSVAIFALVFALAVAPRQAESQGGYFGVGTFSQTVFSNVTTNGGQIVTLRNVGQSSHWLTFCVSGGTVSTLIIQLEASFDGTNWFAISEQASPTGPFQGCQVLEASGYFAQLRVDMSGFATGGGGGALNAWYSATQNAIGSDGLLRGGKASQPVTTIPNATFSNTALLSAGAALSAGQASVYEVSIFNPNTATVFVLISPVVKSNGTTTSAVYGVPAGSSRDIAIPNGMETAANSIVACANTAAGTGDPVTGCVVTVNFKVFSSATGGFNNLSPN